MQALIQITTNEQGSSAVSARELYEFLDVKQQFADWIKNRVAKYGFVEGLDYGAVEDYSEKTDKVVEGEPDGFIHKTMKNSRRGRIATDYALTLDMAKELSMVERNAKGKQARQYFIEAERQLRQLVTEVTAPASLSTEQVLLQQAHALVDQQNQINQLREDITQALKGIKPPRVPRSANRSTVGPPHKQLAPVSDLRQLINRRVNEYCSFHGATQQETYHYLYRRLHEVYSINAWRLVKQPSESMLDALDRYGQLERLHGLIMAELAYVEE